MAPMSIQFARAVHTLTAATRAAGLVPPAFCSPPRRPNAVRTIRRAPSGHVVVAVRLTGRTLDDVLADMVDGVLVANQLHGDAQTRLRSVLRDAVGAPLPPPDGRHPERVDGVREVASGPQARMAERQTQAA